MRVLHMGNHGDDVRRLQQQLKLFEPSLGVDGVYGSRTERAVRLVQRRWGLFPADGIYGPQTAAALRARSSGAQDSGSLLDDVSDLARRAGSALQAVERGVEGWIANHFGSPASIPAPLRQGVLPSVQRAVNEPASAGVASPVAGMRMSLEGRRFIIRHETQRGVSNRLHHPTMGSGVTIGPGYDMKDRTQAEVAGHLRLVGVEPVAAAKAAEGAGMEGSRARQFVQDNRSLLNLSDDRQAALLTHIVGHYEAMVRRAISIELHQHEFDAMVTYAYNPGGGWRKTTRLINERKPADAMVELSRHVYSKGERVSSLVRRREAESRMFLYGEYR